MITTFSLCLALPKSSHSPILSHSNSALFKIKTNCYWKHVSICTDIHIYIHSCTHIHAYRHISFSPYNATLRIFSALIIWNSTTNLCALLWGRLPLLFTDFLHYLVFFVWNWSSSQWKDSEQRKEPNLFSVHVGVFIAVILIGSHLGRHVN